MHDVVMETIALPVPGRTTTRTRVRRVRAARRRSLEAAGWRTWLTYQENHHRNGTGRMVALDERWVVELEHVDGTAFAVEARTPGAAWALAWERARTAARDVGA